MMSRIKQSALSCRKYYFFLLLVCVQQKALTQKAPPLFSAPALRSLFHSDVRAQRMQFTFKTEGQAGGGGRSRTDWEAGSVTSRVRGLQWVPADPSGPQRATIKCRLRHHPRLSVSSRTPPPLPPLLPPPRRSACPAVSLLHRRSLRLTLNLFGSGLKAQRGS